MSAEIAEKKMLNNIYLSITFTNIIFSMHRVSNHLFIKIINKNKNKN
jgi:uncharacterized FlaG/YvyC family protein